MSDVKKIAQLLKASVQAEVQGMESLYETSQLVGKLRKMIYFLQLERGASALHLVLGEVDEKVDYTKYRALFCEERRVFDSLIEQWLDNSQGKAVQSGIFISIAKSLNLMNSVLFDVRRDVDSQSISPAQATSFFSQVIKSFIDIVVEMTELPQEPDVSKLMVSLIYILNAKELAGQERALGTYIKAAKLFNDEVLVSQLSSVIQMQDYNLIAAKDYLPQHLLEGLKTLSQDKAFFQSRESVLDPSLFGVLVARKWFEASTAHIDIIQNLEESLMQLVMKTCVIKLTQAEKLLNKDEIFFDNHITEPDVKLDVSLSAKSLLIEKLKQQGGELKKTQEELALTRQALNEQKILQRAKAKLMKHFKLSEEVAHQKMQQLAMSQGEKIITVAEKVLKAD
ncbi:hypothetical protein CYQ88_03400 [Hydrogenovibrio sp. SC-1]|uniref:nitrate regulatory protein n=1 Tax=Hydrogenovibrio sp. SC-1 TaxID=2065820 RepID=UPI000C7BB806|nr:nitrate regulatory protein [Hydrogenovibrio sp. SC-1]PLA74958.1 hypothetical protein CYQ88_03400 [Hydrogenovibrio sp. SC-1]